MLDLLASIVFLAIAIVSLRHYKKCCGMLLLVAFVLAAFPLLLPYIGSYVPVNDPPAIVQQIAPIGWSVSYYLAWPPFQIGELLHLDPGPFLANYHLGSSSEIASYYSFRNPYYCLDFLNATSRWTILLWPIALIACRFIRRK
jgi:hypothetical protein